MCVCLCRAPGTECSTLLIPDLISPDHVSGPSLLCTLSTMAVIRYGLVSRAHLATPHIHHRTLRPFPSQTAEHYGSQTSPSQTPTGACPYCAHFLRWP